MDGTAGAPPFLAGRLTSPMLSSAPVLGGPAAEGETEAYVLLCLCCQFTTGGEGFPWRQEPARQPGAEEALSELSSSPRLRVCLEGVCLGSG